MLIFFTNNSDSIRNIRYTYTEGLLRTQLIYLQVRGKKGNI